MSINKNTQTADITLHHGDCLEVMQKLIDQGVQVDSIVTDPPYHLTSVSRGGSPRNNDPSTPFGRTRLGERGFMGKTWDGGDIAFNTKTWELAFKLLKPGGHLLAFSGARTYHRMAVAIEDAGFEIRDQIMWIYGSGMPKSLDVSKAIDKAGGMSPAEQSALLKQRREASGLTREEVAASVGCTPASVRDWEEGRARATGQAVENITPSPEYRRKLADLLGYTDDERVAIGVTQDRRGDGTVIGLGHSGVLTVGGNTAAAKTWQGWGTALKPAHEPIVVARKPLIGTVATNVLKHGTGAINIDACRIDGRERTDYGLSNATRTQKNTFGAPTANADFDATKGRWPANVIHDGSDEVLAEFARYGGKGDGESNAGKGTAARFFYSSKVSKSDRMGTNHPTTKPTGLISYLANLVTPKGGTILDPFAGSGTLAAATIHNGFRAILIERELEYVEMIKQRLAHMKAENVQEISPLSSAV